MPTPDNKTQKFKLALHRESLATLGVAQLATAVGGNADVTGFCPTWPGPRTVIRPTVK